MTPAMAPSGGGAHAAGLGMTANAPGAGFELNSLLRILIERRVIILGIGAVGLILGIIIAMMTTPLYRAAAMIELNSEASQVVDQARSAGSTQYSAPRQFGQEQMLTQVGLLKSEALARRVVQDLNLASNPAYGGAAGTRDQRSDRATAIVQGTSSVDPVRNSLLIQVSNISPDPQQAAKVANALVKAFISTSLERRYDSSSYARKFLGDQLGRTKAALEDSERSLNTYAIDSNLFKTPGQVVDGKSTPGGTLAASDLAAMNEALNQARVRRITAEQAYRNARPEFLAEQATNISPIVAQRATLQAEYEEKGKLFKPEYPQMRQIAAQISRLDSIISSERGHSTTNKRAELQGEFAAAQNAEAALTARVASAKASVQGEESRSGQYNILQREVDTNRALYDALLQRYKEIGVAGGIGQSNVSLVDAASPPGGPYRPNMMLNALTGLLLGIALGVGLAFAIHLLFDNIVEPADIRSKLHLPVLGVVPMESGARTLMEALADRKSDVSEAYYSVRTALKFSRPEGAPKTLLVTSSRPGEGKSTSAYAIASNIARLGGKVLLIDADLRKPTFVSSRDDGYGLAHLLGSEEPLSAYTEPTQVENLSLLPVGRFVGSAAELLSSSRLPAIIAEAASQYEMVVLDGPPVLGLTDAPLLASVAEATTIVIESRMSRTTNVVEMIRRLTDAGGHVIGAILTKVTGSGSAYGYNYYSYTYGDHDVGGKVSSDPSRQLDLGRNQA